ncbi:MAG: NAD-dependent DNA ligase LigA, partial [Bacilli bacterium]|nr:NAD-dependent DNA ligase LigA [Bacilli bacterium]
PNAIFDPVHVDGSLVSKATLHNYDYIVTKDIRVGDVISIRKAGDVIPEVVEVKLDRRKDDSKKTIMIDNCPICGSKLVKKDANHYCVNEHCDARHMESIEHYVSRDAMNIDGFGERIVEDFYNEGFVKSIVDLYHLEKYKFELMSMEGFGEKSITNLLDSIEASKSNSLERLLFALGIRYVGKKTAKILAMHYKELDSLQTASYDELKDINDVGDIIAKSIVDYFSDEKNINTINALKELGINTKYLGKEINTDSNVSGKTFVITGTLSKPRDYYKEVLESLGAKVTESVTKKTDYVLLGENPGSKYNKAKELGITIISEEEYEELVM